MSAVGIDFMQNYNAYKCEIPRSEEIEDFSVFFQDREETEKANAENAKVVAEKK